MKSIIFLSMAAGLLIIGIHQAMVHGITESYWIFMFSVCFLLLYRYTAKPGGLDAPPAEPPAEAPKKGAASVRQRLKRP
jgi:hypothetical protein